MSQMATRQWMITHEWMVKPMHQREWIERRGIMIWIAETFTSLGAGLYLVSLFMNSWWGLLVGWLIIMFLKLPIHLAYFGKPCVSTGLFRLFQMPGKHPGSPAAFYFPFSSALLLSFNWYSAIPISLT